MSALSSLFRRALYEVFYLRGNPPWDTGITPPEVKQLVETEHLPPGRALDIGCGTGTNVVYLAQHGFDVTGIDLVPRAIAKGREKARKVDVKVDLRVADVLQPIDFAAPFDFVLDIGCFHNFANIERARYADNLARWTHPGSIYLVYAFFPRTLAGRNFGLTPSEMRRTFEPRFRLVNSSVDENNPEQDSAWYRWIRS